MTFSRTPVNKSERNLKGLQIEIPSSPKFEEVSENNPEFGLPEVVDTSTPGQSKQSNQKQKTGMEKRSAFFGYPEIYSNISSSEASMTKTNQLNVLADQSEQRMHSGQYGSKYYFRDTFADSQN